MYSVANFMITKVEIATMIINPHVCMVVIVLCVCVCCVVCMGVCPLCKVSLNCGYHDLPTWRMEEVQSPNLEWFAATSE